MNLLQLQNALKNYSDEQLMNEMVQPSGMTPQYLVMTEMQRRKQMRDEYAAQPQPSTSIADEMTQEAQMGLASLQQQSMGQNVPSMSELPMGQNVPPVGFADGGLVGSDPLGLLNRKYQIMQDETLSDYQKSRLIRQLDNPGQPDFSPDAFVDADPLTAFGGAGPEQPNAGLIPSSDRPIPISTAIGSAAKSVWDWARPEYKMGEKIRQHEMSSEQLRDADYHDFELPYSATAEASPTGAPHSPTPAGGGGSTGGGAGTGGGIGSMSFTDLLAEAYNMPYSKGVAEQYQGLASTLEGMREGVAKQAEQDKWMSLAQAGMAMASGESPYFATNVGRGGMVGLEAMGKARSEAAKREMDMLGVDANIIAANDAAARGNASIAAQFYAAAIDADYKNKLLPLERMKAEAAMSASKVKSDSGMNKLHADIVKDWGNDAMAVSRVVEELEADGIPASEENIKMRLSQIVWNVLNGAPSGGGMNMNGFWAEYAKRGLGENEVSP